MHLVVNVIILSIIVRVNSATEVKFVSKREPYTYDEDDALIEVIDHIFEVSNEDQRSLKKVGDSSNQELRPCWSGSKCPSPLISILRRDKEYNVLQIN